MFVIFKINLCKFWLFIEVDKVIKKECNVDFIKFIFCLNILWKGIFNIKNLIVDGKECI